VFALAGPYQLNVLRQKRFKVHAQILLSLNYYLLGRFIIISVMSQLGIFLGFVLYISSSRTGKKTHGTDV
jgi:hypothetical protein